ncbi:MAG: 6-pyruvoyl-tetrahydropterin synthase-related protein [Patescibacteria group bacterium]
MKKFFMKWGIWTGLVALSLLPLWDLMHPGLPITHDGQDHVARIANFYQSLSEGHVVPRWAANLNWGYGHPILMFLYPLPSYVASAFHFVGFSLIDSTKLVFAFGFIASMLAMYLWITSAWGVAAGITASVLYAFAPYRFVDLYVRGAIGEHMAFVFPPLICYGLLLLAKEKNHISAVALTVISFGTALLILSHNALSLIFLPLIGLYALYLAAQETKTPIRFLLMSIAGILFGFLLSAFYWVPGYFEGKYTLRDIVTKGEFTGRFVPWFSFLYSPWSYGGGNELSKWLGAGQILALGLSFFALEKNTKHRRFIIVCMLLLFFSLFAMTANSAPVWNAVTLLQKFQFPWRLMSVTVFLIAGIGAFVVYIAPEKSRRWTALILVIISIFGTIPMWRAKEYKVFPQSYFTGIYNSTTDTGESSPIWSIRFMEKRPEALAYMVPLAGTINVGERSTTLKVYRVNVKEPARFVESTLYFPGWQVFINGSPLAIEKLIFQDPTYRGLMTFDLTPGDYDIRFEFGETKLRRISNYLSLGALALFVVSIGTIRLLWRKKE